MSWLIYNGYSAIISLDIDHTETFMSQLYWEDTSFYDQSWHFLNIVVTKLPSNTDETQLVDIRGSTEFSDWSYCLLTILLYSSWRNIHWVRWTAEPPRQLKFKPEVLLLLNLVAVVLRMALKPLVKSLGERETLTVLTLLSTSM